MKHFLLVARSLWSSMPANLHIPNCAFTPPPRPLTDSHTDRQTHTHTHSHMHAVHTHTPRTHTHTHAHTHAHTQTNVPAHARSAHTHTHPHALAHDQTHTRSILPLRQYSAHVLLQSPKVELFNHQCSSLPSITDAPC